MIASNTMDSSADLIKQQEGLPVLQIANSTGAQIQRARIKTVLLLGTTFTMEAPFDLECLQRRFGQSGAGL